MMTMTVAMAANLHDTRSVGSTKIAGTGNRHRGGRQDPCNDGANDNQALAHFYPSQISDKTRGIQPGRGTLVPGLPKQIRSASVAVRQGKMEEVAMKRAILFSGHFACCRRKRDRSREAGCSSLSPGHEMQNSMSSSTKGDIDTKTKGASEYSPGDRMHDKSTTGMSKSKTKGASEYSPGDRMHDRK
jgi:hypothetical protein